MKKIVLLLAICCSMITGCTHEERHHIPNLKKVKLIHQFYTGCDEHGVKQTGLGGYNYNWALIERIDNQQRIQIKGIYGKEGEIFTVDINTDEGENN